MRILIAEDDQVLADGLLRTLRGSGAVVDRCILDKEVTVGNGAVVGEGNENIPNRERPDIVNAGITIVGKRVSVPAGLHVGRNVVIGPGVARDEGAEEHAAYADEEAEIEEKAAAPDGDAQWPVDHFHGTRHRAGAGRSDRWCPW